MALATSYKTGTVTVGASSTTVTGSGTAFQTAGLQAGDVFWAAGLSVSIASVNSQTGLTLAFPWPGAGLSAANYEVRYINDGARANAQQALLLAQLAGGNLTALSALVSAANKLPYFSGAGVAAQTDLTAFARTLLDDATQAAAQATLGVTTQAALDDATADRLIKTGGFGLGGRGVPLSNFNGRPQTGVYRGVGSTTGNVPGPEAAVARFFNALVTVGTNSDERRNFLYSYPYDDNKLDDFYLGGTDGAGTAVRWTRIFTQGSILGTVSEASGVPTGRVIERGSNASGDYVRFADGTQICTRSMAAASGAAATWTFPAAFAAAPVVTGTAQAVVLSVVCLDTAPTTTAVTFSARDKTDARRADTVRIQATGRWF